MNDTSAESNSAPRLKRGPTRSTIVLIVAILVTAAMAVLVGLLGPGPQARPFHGLRLVVIDRDGLATTDPAGRTVTRFDLGGTPLLFPAFSPDGSKLAAIVDLGDETGIAVAADPGGSRHPTVIYRSATAQPFYLYWTLDSRNVAFLTQEASGLALRVAPADGSHEAATLQQGAPLYWAAESAARLLIHRGSGPGAFLGEIALDGTAEPTIVPEPGRFQAPATAPEAARRAYVSVAGGVASVVIEGVTGAESRSVAIHDPAALAFESTGRTLAFVSPEATSQFTELAVGPLRAIDAGNGEVRTLLDGLVIAYFWSPDGKTIAVLRITSSGGGGVASTIAAAPTPVVQLVFVDAASGAVRSQQAVKLSALFIGQFLPYFDQYALSHRIWSSVSSAVALPLVADDGTTHLSVIPADGSRPRAVGAATVGFWAP